MDYKDFQALTDEQLVHKGLQIERDLIAARFALQTNQLADTSAVGKYRKDLARVQTSLRERERAAGQGRNHLSALYGKTFQPAVSSENAGEGAGFLKGIVDKISSNE